MNNKDFEPRIYYYDAQETEYCDEETLAAQGVKLISFEYPTPIENSFVFSHISYFSGAVVLPTLFIALLALIATIIFVKKDKELQYKSVDIVSIVLNTTEDELPFSFSIQGKIVKSTAEAHSIGTYIFYSSKEENGGREDDTF